MSGMLYLSVMMAASSVVYVMVRYYQANEETLRSEAGDPLGPFRPPLRLVGQFNRRLFPGHIRRKAPTIRFVGLDRHVRPEEFLAIKELVALGAAGLSFLLGTGTVVVPLVAGLVGFLYPEVWLKSRVKKRRRFLIRQLPGLLDFILVGMTAGADFRRSMQLATQQLGTGPAVDEFSEVVSELQLGVPLNVALHNLAERVQLPEVTSVVSVITQCEQVGASMQEALSSKADLLRTQRFQLAEKLAGEAPVKILFPLIFLILPCLMGVVLLPVILHLVLTLMDWR